MTGLWDPNNYYGRMGDVYIQTTLYGEEIYIKGEDNRWHEWHKKVDYGIKKWANSPDKFKHSYHPWLRSRLLQFDGTALDWHPRRQYFHHRTAWNAGTHHTLGAPVYDDLDVAWIVRHLNALAVSRGLDPYNSTVCSASSSGVSVGTCVVSETFHIERTEPNTNIEWQDPPAPKAVAPQATKQTVQDFLGSLSISLAHHADLFANLGITDLPYMESLACMSKHFLESFVATLRERGFTFMEALVLRSGLNTLRVAAHPKREAPQTSPDTIEVFLKCLSPSLACHARIFDELDINVAHLPVFAKLDADSYGEFEKELSERGVSWVDMFLIKAGLQAFAETREEPLLATG
ncbi:hypothetical protein C8Q80DRAFT_1115898 [Daedaleopsis nitida]|nr:hypothetical protein C8Q80DRAFT_1115898 [Daedaleopsis nitida]